MPSLSSSLMSSPSRRSNANGRWGSDHKSSALAMGVQLCGDVKAAAQKRKRVDRMQNQRAPKQSALAVPHSSICSHFANAFLPDLTVSKGCRFSSTFINLEK